MGVFERFRSDQRGATAMIFGVAILPMVGLVGAAVDYSRAAREHTKVQRATDAAALSLAREPRTASDAQLSGRAERVFSSVYPMSRGLSREPVQAQRLGDAIVVRSRVVVTNAFMQVLGIAATPVATEARVQGSQERIELALVLDNTGSMRERIGSKVKIEELRSAAQALVDQLRDTATGPDDVRLSVVPFDTEVRVDANRYRYRDWLRWTSAGERAAWTGYVVDRDLAKDTTDDRPVMALPDTLYPAQATSQWASVGDLPAVQPLTSLYESGAGDSVKATIRSMQPRGNTNVGLGVSWGTATLTGSVPLDTPATSDRRAVKRYMVVLTDGVNTQRWVDGQARQVRNPNDPSPSDPVLRLMNTRTLAACDTAKAQGIEMFTIRLLDGDAAMLGSCASAPNAKAARHYFDVQSAGGLKGAFDDIVDAVTGTRLTQ